MAAGEQKTPSKRNERAQARTISLRLQGPQLAALDRRAERMGMTRSAVIQMALALFLQKEL
ncbi:MAG TPA: ribbon-helix-helix protein, CopG family [Acidisarcina sp.]|nr:ribbon-helix-helix protein, CopG family [Acidisarcina sp.]